MKIIEAYQVLPDNQTWQNYAIIIMRSVRSTMIIDTQKAPRFYWIYSYRAMKYMT
jgi:hypothetical protein